MLLSYDGKKTEKEIIKKASKLNIKNLSYNGKSMLIHGENLAVLNSLCNICNLKGGIDLVYIDPPFSTNNVFTIGKNRVSTISNNKSDEIAYADTLKGGDFIEFLRERLVLLRELMSNHGSIYLHIDYKIGHYVKVMMDEVFGTQNFRNDITRIKCNPKNFSRQAYGNIKDLILFYSKGRDVIWNNPKDKMSVEEVSNLCKKVDNNGRRYTTIPLHAPGVSNGITGAERKGMLPPEGRHRRTSPDILEERDNAGLIEWSKNGVPRKIVYAEEKGMKKKQDIWEYKDPQYPKYPTEKNIDLLMDIIKASSNKDSIVLDCFSGSGTTLLASETLGRKRIGIDQSENAIEVSKGRLDKIYADYDFFK